LNFSPFKYKAKSRSASHLLTSAPAHALLLRILVAGVLLCELVLINDDIHRPQIGFDAALFVLCALLDDPVIGTDGQVDIADLGEVQGIDGLLIQLDLLPLGEHIHRGRDVVEADSDLEVVPRSLALLPRFANTDVPAVVDETLGQIGIVDVDAEIALSGAVVLALPAGEIPEQDMSVLNRDAFGDSGVCHG